MKNKFFIFHPHSTPEENPRVKYHIVSNNNIELKTLCGIDTTKKLLNYSCNGDAIKWYNQNLKYNNGIVCKKCVNKFKKIMENKK